MFKAVINSCINRANAFQQQLHGIVNQQVAYAAPAMRKAESAYVSLQKEVNGQYQDVGTFVMGFYQLATAPGSLKCQIEEQQFIAKKRQIDPNYQHNTPENLTYFQQQAPKLFAKLYIQDQGQLRAKSPFELAILKSNNLQNIRDAVRKEYQWQQDNGLLPQIIFKNRMLEDYLTQLEAAGFAIKLQEDGQSQAQQVTVNLPNLAHKARFKEKLLHYSAQWLATLTTLSAVLTASALTNPGMAIVAGGLTYYALKAAHGFDFFDKAEMLWLEGRWLSSDKFKVDRFSPYQAAKSLFFLSAMAFIAYQGAAGVFASTVIPGLSASLNTGLAVAMSTFSFLGTWAGLSVPVRFAHGLSINDNTISVKQLSQAKVELLAPHHDLPKHKRYKSKLSIAERKIWQQQIEIAQLVKENLKAQQDGKALKTALQQPLVPLAEQRAVVMQFKDHSAKSKLPANQAAHSEPESGARRRHSSHG